MAAVTMPAFLTWMNETITHLPASGTSDRYGRRAMGTGVSVQCYADERVTHVHGNEGWERHQATVLYCATDAIEAEDKITFRGQTREISSVFTVRDETGAVHHQEVSLA